MVTISRTKSLADSERKGHSSPTRSRITSKSLGKGPSYVFAFVHAQLSLQQYLIGYEATKLPGSSGSLLTLRTTSEHSARRRIWNNGFTPSALKGYEPMIHRRASQLLSRLQAHDKETVNLSAWLSYFRYAYT